MTAKTPASFSFIVITTQNDVLWKIKNGLIEVLKVDDPLYPASKAWADKIERQHEPVPTSSPLG